MVPETQKGSEPCSFPISHLSQEAGVCEKRKKQRWRKGGAGKRKKRRGGRDKRQEGGGENKKWRRRREGKTGVEKGGGGEGEGEEGGREGLTQCPRGCWPLLRWPDEPCSPSPSCVPPCFSPQRDTGGLHVLEPLVQLLPQPPRQLLSCTAARPPVRPALTPWPGTKSPQRHRVSPSLVTDETLSQHQESWLLPRHCSGHHISLGYTAL